MHCILVIKGDIFRQRCDDGKTGFIFNEAPRLIINEVEGVVGDPMPLVKACQQAKYDDMATKYHDGYFKIPYSQQLFNRYVARTIPLTTNKEVQLQLVDRISDLPASQYRNNTLFPILKDSNISLIILSYAYYLDKARILLKRISRLGFNLSSTSAEDANSPLFDRFIRKRVEVPIASS
jgi:hypothetical protein